MGIESKRMCLVPFFFFLIIALIGKMPESHTDSEFSKNEDLELFSQFRDK